MSGSANILRMGEAEMVAKEVFASLMDPIHPNSFSVNQQATYTRFTTR